MDQTSILQLSPEFVWDLGMKRIPTLAKLTTAARSHDKRYGDVGRG